MTGGVGSCVLIASTATIISLIPEGRGVPACKIPAMRETVRFLLMD